MKTKEFILQFAQSHERFTTQNVAQALGLSRQAVAKHLQEFVKQGRLERFGRTRGAVYCLAQPTSHPMAGEVDIYTIKGLDEARVFHALESKYQLKQKLSPEAYATAQFALTEMVNNAIDHSQSKEVHVAVHVNDQSLVMAVRDQGIGVFESIRLKFHLKNHFEALEHLLKGKQTTDPDRHSGQGIFFTSRLVDCFELESGITKWQMDNTIDDFTVEKIRFCNGTLVTFHIDCQAKRAPKDVFDQYTNEDFEFDKTEIKIKLSPKEGSYVSRSEAKRIVMGLDEFKRIVFDFKDVSSVGQGFADQIFRVFQNEHSHIQLQPINMCAEVEFMVKRVEKGKS